MTHYNPKLHHDKVLLHIAHSYLTGYELDTPFHPPRNDGKANNVILYTEDEMYSIEPQVFQRLEEKALTYAYHRAKFVIAQYEDFEKHFKTDCHPKNIPNDGNPFYEQDPETSRQESIKRAFASTVGMSEEKHLMKIDYTK